MTQALHTFWPDEAQRLLLHVAMDEDPLPAWSTWCERVPETEQLDEGSYRLLPYVYQRLSGLNMAGERVQALKPLYERTWAHNQLLLHQAAKLLRALREADISTLVLKGIPLSVAYYKDLGTRPMGDIDMAVPSSHARAAVDWFVGRGWKPETDDVDGYLRHRHAISLRQGNVELDLHWKFFFEAPMLGDREGALWDRAQTIEVCDEHTRTLNPTDLLLTTLAHGMRWNPVPAFRWMVDAQMILQRAGSEVDWSALVAQAEAYRIARRCADALEYLHREFKVEMPEVVVAELRSVRATWLERAEYRCYRQPSSWSGLNPAMLTLAVTQYGRVMHGAGWMRAMTGLPGYLRYRLRGKRVMRRLLRGEG